MSSNCESKQKLKQGQAFMVFKMQPLLRAKVAKVDRVTGQKNKGKL